MLEVSVGCRNPHTYGLSCTFCKECGRKFTINGVDDSEVVNRNTDMKNNIIDKKVLINEISIRC